jgi:hypothetical protein
MEHKATPELLLHETPILRALLKRVQCLLKGGHRYPTVERMYLDTDEQGMRHYSRTSVCAHCRHFLWQDEYAD